ncbi:MAG: hypothetical protein C5B56_09090, partial [Proteobacteria bacterium]
MFARSFLVGIGALLTISAGTSLAGSGDTFRLGMSGRTDVMSGQSDVMTLEGKGDAQNVQVWRGGWGGRGWGGGWGRGWGGGWGRGWGG